MPITRGATPADATPKAAEPPTVNASVVVEVFKPLVAVVWCTLFTSGGGRGGELLVLLTLRPVRLIETGAAPLLPAESGRGTLRQRARLGSRGSCGFVRGDDHDGTTVDTAAERDNRGLRAQAITHGRHQLTQVIL